MWLSVSFTLGVLGLVRVNRFYVLLQKETVPLTPTR